MDTSITTRSITAMLLLPLLAAAFLVLTTLPARATPPGNSGYLAMRVADLPGAVHFFRTMLNCAPLDANAVTSHTALLDCGNDNIVSLTYGEAAYRVGRSARCLLTMPAPPPSGCVIIMCPSSAAPVS